MMQREADVQGEAVSCSGKSYQGKQQDLFFLKTFGDQDRQLFLKAEQWKIGTVKQERALKYIPG